MRAVHPRFGEWRRSTLSAFSRENLKRVPLTDLAPTQMTVGMREVDHKRRRWRERSAHEAADFLSNVRIPVVMGPGVRPYLLDRHHLALALHNEGVKALHGHLAYDSGEFKTVFLRPVMRSAKETSLEAHFVLQPA